MTKGFQRFTKRHVSVLVVLIGLAVAVSILFYSGCGMTGSPNTPARPTPTPAPTPDNLRPTSMITFPTVGALISNETTVNITGTASDAGGGTVQSVQVSVDGGATWNMATGTTAWSYAWLPTRTGSALIKSRATDNSGNIQDPPAEVSVIVQDRTRPTSTITFPPAGGSVSAFVTVNISGTASDAGGGTVQSVQVSVDGGATWNPATGTTAWSYSWTPLTLGPVTIKSRALDTWGNQQDPPAEVTVTVQDTMPPTSGIIAPRSGSTLPIGIPAGINGTASDAGGGSAAKVEVSVDGGATWNVALGTTTWSYNFTPTALGPVTIKVRAVDTSGNQQDPPLEITVTIVDPPPTATIVSPPSGAVNVSVETNVVVHFSKAMDPATVNESTVVLKSAGGTPSRVSYDADSRSATLDPIEPLIAGVPYTVEVKGGDAGVKDLAGNAMLSTEFSFFTTIAEPPRIVSTTPERDANNVATGVALGATFSKALRIQSINASSVLLTDAANNPVPVTISYAPISF